MVNVQLNWLLMAYLLPNTRPGVVADRITAQATLATLKERAFAFACRNKFYDPDLADEALCSMLAWVATSRICERFTLERGTPRQFIDKVLANFVTLEIRKKYRRVVGPLHESLQSGSIDPALDAEIRELTVLCEAQFANDDHDERSHGGVADDAENKEDGAAGVPTRTSPDAPKSPGSKHTGKVSNKYLRRHRWRKRRWMRVKAFFPELGDRGMRPKRRRHRRKR